MQKQNMNWFSTVPRVVICFIILTYITEFSVGVLCGWSVRWSRRSRCEKKEERQELKLGDARGTPSKYSRRLKRLSLGCWRGIPSFFNKYRYVFGFVSFMRYVQILERLLHLGFYFIFMNHAGMRWSLVYLYNAHCTSLISFEYGFIECFMCFTYIIWSLDCLFLFT